MNLFAYGTLMGRDGFRETLGARADRLAFRVARLEGWRRVWNGRRDEWDGAILNVEPDAEGSVVGVLVEGLEAADWAALDEQERSHLPRETVSVVTEDDRALEAAMYRQRHGLAAGRASAPYQRIVLERAAAAGPRVLESVRASTSR